MYAELHISKSCRLWSLVQYRALHRPPKYSLTIENWKMSLSVRWFPQEENYNIFESMSREHKCLVQQGGLISVQTKANMLVQEETLVITYEPSQCRCPRSLRNSYMAMTAQFLAEYLRIPSYSIASSIPLSNKWICSLTRTSTNWMYSLSNCNGHFCCTT